MGRKNIILIVMAILVVAGAFAFAEYRNKYSEKLVYDAPIVTSGVSSSGENLSSEILNEYANKDSDEDGLKDWEELLSGTDPHKADTDGNGIKDGKEPRSSSGTTAVVVELSPTDKLARDFFARYMELNQVGLTGDAASQTELIGQVLKNGMVLATPKTYSLKDIVVIQDTSTVAIKKYGNEVGGIFQRNQNLGRDEAVIAREAVEKEEPEILKEIDPIISIYKNIVQSLLKVQVPQNEAKMHVDTINAMNKFLFVAESLRQTNVDPLRGLQGASTYLEAGESLFNALRALSRHFSSLGISFTTSEGGAIFTPF